MGSREGEKRVVRGRERQREREEGCKVFGVASKCRSFWRSPEGAQGLENAAPQGAESLEGEISPGCGGSGDLQLRRDILIYIYILHAPDIYACINICFTYAIFINIHYNSWRYFIAWWVRDFDA